MYPSKNIPPDHILSITYDYIDDYLYRIAPPRDNLLERMEEYEETNSVPVIGPLVGRLLYNLAKTSQSRKVLEIGTAIGYSGIWLARAIAPLKGGLFVADNALCGGDVAKGGKSKDTQAMIKFNRLVTESPGMSTVILPLRDGVLVSLKE